MAQVKVASTAEVAAGQCKTVEANGKQIALYNVDGTFYATDNTCLHRGGPLGEGTLNGNKVTCPWHGWEYDVTTGKNSFNPQVGVATYPVKVDGDAVMVDI
jgi:nitrite reductase (NADH) small subunit